MLALDLQVALQALGEPGAARPDAHQGTAGLHQHACAGQQVGIERFGIDTIPTLMLFKDGKVLGSIVAPASKAAIETFIRETLAQ